MYGEELWLSEEFSAIEMHKMMKEYEQELLYEYLIEQEALPDDPVKCGEYFDLLEAIDEYTIK